LPVKILWFTRISLFFLSYQYHSLAGLVNLVWVITSILVSSQTTFLITTYIGVPLFTWEFIMVYCSRIAFVKDLFIFEKLGDYFTWDMKQNALEQTWMFITLMLIWA
jgi:hypothetical protein